MSNNALEINCSELNGLIRHMWVHDGYRNNGYLQMTTEQKNLYCSIIGAKFTQLAPEYATAGKAGIMTPQRIQRRRTRGWRMPENTVYVGRPTKFGNPWTPEKYWAAGYLGSLEVAIGHCVDAYRAWIEGHSHWAHGELQPIPDPSALRGKDLACWCPIGQRCHADVLLEIANSEKAGL